MYLHFSWKTYYNDDNDNDTSDGTNCANGAHEATCIAVGKGHAEAIGAVVLWKNLNQHDANNANNDSGNYFAISSSKDKTLKKWNAHS